MRADAPLLPPGDEASAMTDDLLPPGDEASAMTDAPPRQAAMAWLARLQRGATAAERRDFAAWRDADPSHARAWQDAEVLWDLAEAPGQQVAQEEAAALGAYLRAMDDGKARRRRTTRVAGAALALLLMLGGGGLWLERPALYQDLLADAATARGERRQVALPDGSTVLLEADSALDWRFDGTARRLRLLRGAGFFAVRPDAVPFIVEAAGGEVRVRGTRFETRLVGEEAMVTLAEGSVAVTPGGEATATVLTPGQRLRFGGRRGAAESVSLDQALAWRDGRFAFHRMPLAEVLEELGRYRPGRILLLDAALGRQPVSGSFSLDDPDAALAALQSGLGFRLRQVAGRLVLVGD
ncbi:FecR domain-containing protein [Roseomonas sp. 18066]|uniref:FecR family protein n=1 Tax=Roseomonas sp. 18066 TaxID=2681412 RepID=UPI00135C4F64|nr:FecR domain-containing protein [Roseomonas sp. 18066]